MKKNISVLCVLIIGFIPALSNADEHYASSLSPTDIQMAVIAAIPGDTVVLPSGDYSGFNKTIFVPNGISLRGQGKDRTILRNTSSSIYLFVWNSTDTTSSYKVRISGLKLIGHGPDSGSGIRLENVLEFAIYDLQVRDFGGVGVATYGSSRGLIYSSDFINIFPYDLSGSGYGVGVYGDGIWDDPKPPLGTKSAVFVEDCYFNGCKHAIASNADSHYVFRYNKVAGLINNRQAVDAHGKQSQYQCGSNTYEIYKNMVTGSGLTTQTDWGIVVRGGSGVIYDNTILKCDPGLDTPPKAIGVGIDDHQSYPDPYQVRDLYVWGNTHDGQAIVDVFVTDETAYYVKKDREYFLYKKPGYVSYAYPHPLRATASPLTVSISASPVSGQAPLTVSFKGTATGGISPYTYTWNFGDGKASTTQNPAHTYQSVAKFTATLTVRDSQGASDTDSIVIIVTSVPAQLEAYASASPLSGQVPLYVKFSGQASGGVAPYTYRWNFGDQTNWTTQNPSHTYESAGVFVATLYLTDSLGATDTTTVTITVTAPPPRLTASASASPQSGLPPLSVNFSGSAQGGTPPYSYKWNFGDGDVSAVQNPVHTYSNEGNFAAVLTVTDAASTSATSPIAITVMTASTYNLILSARTGAPAPGQGGTTDPGPGTHSFSVGANVQLKSIANVDYRFSRWGGDVPEFGLFNTRVDVAMNNDKTISATFCTKCADVNGDLLITPADAQAAFDIFLVKIADPTLCEMENADVNGSGAPYEPDVTPADAQAIFNEFLRKGQLPSDCSGASRISTMPLPSEIGSAGEFRLAIDNRMPEPGENLIVPVFIDTAFPLGAFGFDLSFSSRDLAFMGVEWTDLTAGFTQLGANEVDEGIVRVGGYSSQPVLPESAGVLVSLVFRVLQRSAEPTAFSIINTYDDLLRLQVYEGTRHRTKIDRRKPRSSEERSKLYR